jgi:hypothetical protein
MDGVDLVKRWNRQSWLRSIILAIVFFGTLWLGDNAITSGSGALSSLSGEEQDRLYYLLADHGVATIDDSDLAMLSYSGVSTLQTMIFLLALALVALLAIYWEWKDREELAKLNVK